MSLRVDGARDLPALDEVRTRIGAALSSVPARLRAELARSPSLGEGGRSIDEADAFERIRPWVPRAGVTRVGAITGMDRIGLPVRYAVRPASLHATTIISQGKGATEATSLLSALYECHERWAAEHIPPHSFIATSAALDAAFPAVERRAGTHPADAEVAWTVGATFPAYQACFVPLQSVCFPGPPGLRIDGTPADTSGLAAAATVSEAFLHAFWERVERFHASASPSHTWPVIAPETVTGPASTVLDRLVSMGIDVTLRWVGRSRDLAVVYAMSRDPVWRLPTLFCAGTGAHPQRERALESALLELVQSRAGMLSLLRDDLPFRFYDDLTGGYEAASARYGGWFESTAPKVDFAVLPDHSDPALSSQLALAERLARQDLADFPLSVVELSAYPGISVMRVASPGIPTVRHGASPAVRAERVADV